MVALRTQVCAAVGNLNSDTELQGLCRVACKENRSGERDQGLFSSPFLGHYLLCAISTSLPAARDLPPPPIDRSHYKINVTKIAHNASEKCNTISRSLSSF